MTFNKIPEDVEGQVIPVGNILLGDGKVFDGGLNSDGFDR